MILEPDQLRRFWGKISRAPGHGPDGDCWEWTAGTKNREGYGGFYLRQIDNTVTCHKLSFLLTHNFGLDDIPDGIVVRHKCNNPKCVRPNHLALGTCQHNSDDMVRAGNSCTADKDSRAKLSWDKVNAIRGLYAVGNTTFSELARRFDISACQVRVIIRNEGWVDKYYSPPVFMEGHKPSLKFTQEVVRQVRAERQSGVPAKVTAAKLGMSISQYYNIVRGDQRKEVGNG